LVLLFHIAKSNKNPPGRVLKKSDPDWIQTNDLLLRRQLLYSTELPDLISELGRKDIVSDPIGEKMGGLFMVDKASSRWCRSRRYFVMYLRDPHNLPETYLKLD
jgi:hypothetical protein